MGDPDTSVGTETESREPVSNGSVEEAKKPGAKRRWGLRATLLTLAGVIALTAGIYGLSAISAPRAPEGPAPVQLSAEEQSKRAYEEALTALSSGETSAAIALLEKAIALDPTNALATSKLKSIRSSAQSRPDGQSNGGEGEKKPETTTPPAEDPFAKPIENLTALLPKSHVGYELGTVIGTRPDVAVSGTPESTGGLVRVIVWTVHDRGSSPKAKAFIEKVSKGTYGKDASSTQVDGATAYFGTDGTRFATVAYARGRFVFEVLVTSADVPPAEVKTDAIGAAKAFPDKP